jgi:hypothetical protein
MRLAWHMQKPLSRSTAAKIQTLSRSCPGQVRPPTLLGSAGHGLPRKNCSEKNGRARPLLQAMLPTALGAGCSAQ